MLKHNLLALALAFAASGVDARGEDWPTFGHDVARSQTTAEAIQTPLAPCWVYRPRFPPVPAWGAAAEGDGRPERNRVHFDDAFQVAVAGGRLFFGSSADNKVYCLDAASGRIRWTKITGGPVRLAPAVVGDRVYVGSDDGYAYCLRAEDGSVVWQFHAAPEDRRVLGHGRMISLWPVRTGVLVDGPTAYFGAGVFPSEGVFLYAVDAATGREVWRNDGCGETQQSRVSPQGYLLASRSTLYAPMGRVSPAAFERAGGRLVDLPFLGKAVGGTYALLADDRVYTGTEELVAYRPKAPSDRFSIVDGRKLVVAGDTAYVATGSRVRAIARKSYPAVSRDLQALQPRRTRQEQLIQEARQQRSDLLQEIMRLRDQPEAAAELAEKERALDAWSASYDRQQEDRTDLDDQFTQARTALGALDRWDVACPCDQSLILAADVLVAGGDGQVAAFAANSGRSLWTGRVQGMAKGLAVADGRLFVSTDEGAIYCFGPPGSVDRGRTGEGDSPIFVGRKSGQSPAVSAHDAAPASKTRSPVQRAAESILRQSGVRRGYCLILGCETGELALELARRSEMMIYAVSPDREKVETLRKRIDASGLYGGRISVEAWPLDRVPYADYFANLVVSETALLGGQLPVAPAEMFRMMKPVGGVALIGRPSVLLTRRVRPKQQDLGKNAGPNRQGLTQSVTSTEDLTRSVTSTDDLTRSVRSTEDLDRWLAQSKLEGRMVQDDGDWVKIVRGPLAGSGGWTQLYGNAGNTACGDDRRVRWPLSVLWFTAPGPESTVDRHRRSVAPLSIDGRLFCQGQNLLAAYDAYNGITLWQRSIEGAMRTDVSRDCGNLAVDHQALFAAIGDYCLKLDPATGQTLATYDLPPAPKSWGRLWGYVGLSGDRLIGTRTTAGGTSRCLFAVELPGGKHVWSYAGTRISHPSISLGDGLVFFVDVGRHGTTAIAGVAARANGGDGTPVSPGGHAEMDKPEPLVPKEVRRGMPAPAPWSDVGLVVALDARSGEVRWKKPLDLADCHGGAIGTMYGDGVLTIFGVYTDGHYWQQYFQGELAGRRVTAFSGKDGKLLWARAAGYQVRPLIVGDKLIAEPLAFDLHTGKPCTRTNPITGADEPWQFSRPGHHCGCSVASPDCLFFRSYCLGCYDLTGDFGTIHLGGQRPGCWINFIPANGLLLMPEASAGCTCPFPNRCNLAFEPVQASPSAPATPVQPRGFGCYSASGPATPVRRLAVVFGAAGDRNDAAGQLWLGYPRPEGSLILPLDLGVHFCRGGRFLTGNSLYHPVADTADPWRFASAAQGLTSCDLPLLESGDGAAIYRVRLSMAEPADVPPGRRLFDIRLQGRQVLADCDVVQRAGGPHRALVEEFSGIEVADKLHVELVPKTSGRLAPDQMPILQGIEAIRQRVVRLGWTIPSFHVDNAHRSQSGQVQLSNLRDEAFRGRLEVVPPAGFEALPSQAEIELAPGQRKPIEIALRALPTASPGLHDVALRLRRTDGNVELEATTTIEHLGRHGRLVIPACEDAFVLRRYPDLNKGKATVLIVDGGEDAIGDLDHSLAYLKFRLDIPGRPVAVRLRLANAGNPTQDSGRVCRVREPWSETRITYANRPPPAEELGRIGRVGEYQVIECPLKLDLAGVKELSLVIDPTSVDGADYFSREGGKPPALVIEYEEQPN